MVPSLDGMQSPQQPVSSGYAAKIVMIELLKIIALVVVTILVVRYFIFRPFDVKGASMEPNFYEREYLIIDELTYRFNEPSRGDVIVMRHDEDTREYFLKRVIGLPGEKLKIQGGKVVVYNAAHPNGTVVDESAYLPEFVFTPGEQIVTLAPDEYFVMGDNRSVSYDSRRFGAVKRKNIVGRVWLRGWPLDKFGRFAHPDYNL